MQGFINEVLTAAISKIQRNMLPAPFWKWTSTERQWILALLYGQFEWQFFFRHSQMRYWPPLLAKEKATCSLPDFEHMHQRSVHTTESCKSGNEPKPRSLFYIMTSLASLMHNNANYDAPTLSYTWASMEDQWFMALDVRSLKTDLVIVRHNQRIGHLY